MPTVTMQAPTTAYTQITTRSGNTYISDSTGLVTNVDSDDVVDLLSGGYTLVAPGFAPFGVSLLHGRNTDGTSLSAAASAGKFGMSITLGTSSALISQQANNGTITDSVLFDISMPLTFPANHDPTITVNTQMIIGSGTVTTHTLGMHLYAVNEDGTHSADLVTTAAQNLPTSAGDLIFNTSAGGLLAANGRAILEATMNIIETSAHAVQGNINSIKLS